MKMHWKLWTTVMAVILLAGPWAFAQTQTRDGVFIHLSHGINDPRRVLMALQMAEIMSEEKDVLVYFDVQAIEVVLKNAPDVQFKEFPSAKAQLKKLADRKVTLMVCPGCLSAAGKTPADLAPGIQVADKKAFFTFTKGRILSLDY